MHSTSLIVAHKTFLNCVLFVGWLLLFVDFFVACLFGWLVVVFVFEFNIKSVVHFLA